MPNWKLLQRRLENEKLAEAEQELVTAAINWYDLETDEPRDVFFATAMLEGAIAKVKIMRRRR